MLNKLDSHQTRRLLEACPVGMLLLDASGAVCGINETLHAWLGKRAELLADNTVETVPEPLQPLFQPEATVNLPADDHGEELWLIGKSVSLDDGSMVQYFTDATPVKYLMQQRQQLQNIVEELTVTDAETGMPNRRALFNNLESQVSRSRRYGNPLSVLLLQLSNLAQFAQQHEAHDNKPLLIAIRNMLNDQLRWADTIGRLAENEFLLILPETDLASTRKLAELIQSRLERLVIEGQEETDSFRIAARLGIAAWRKGDDSELLLLRARENMEQGGD